LLRAGFGGFGAVWSGDCGFNDQVSLEEQLEAVELEGEEVCYPPDRGQGVGRRNGAKKRSKMTVAESQEDAPFEVDLSKPLVFQVGHLGDRYDEWVHQAIVTKKGPRLFEWDWMEALTNTCWWVIPLIWLPVVVFAEREAIRNGVKPANIPLYMLGGLVIWTFLEYNLHRFLFHAKTSTYWMNTLHYLLHGCHHKHPQDPYRLVFPPALNLVFTACILLPFTPFLEYRHVMALYGGGLLGYVCYDCTHFWVHFGVSTKVPIFYSLRRYHLGHHFKSQNLGFGITSPSWDWVYGTLPPRVAKNKAA